MRRNFNRTPNCETVFCRSYKNCRIKIQTGNEKRWYISKLKTHNKILWRHEVFCFYLLLGIITASRIKHKHLLFSYVYWHLFTCLNTRHVKKMYNVQSHFHQTVFALAEYTNTTVSFRCTLTLLYFYAYISKSGLHFRFISKIFSYTF